MSNNILIYTGTIWFFFMRFYPIFVYASEWFNHNMCACLGSV